MLKRDEQGNDSVVGIAEYSDWSRPSRDVSRDLSCAEVTICFDDEGELNVFLKSDSAQRSSFFMSLDSALAQELYALLRDRYAD